MFCLAITNRDSMLAHPVGTLPGHATASAFRFCARVSVLWSSRLTSFGDMLSIRRYVLPEAILESRGGGRVAVFPLPLALAPPEDLPDHNPGCTSMRPSIVGSGFGGDASPRMIQLKIQPQF